MFRLRFGVVALLVPTAAAMAGCTTALPFSDRVVIQMREYETASWEPVSGVSGTQSGWPGGPQTDNLWTGSAVIRTGRPAGSVLAGRRPIVMNSPAPQQATGFPRTPNRTPVYLPVVGVNPPRASPNLPSAGGTSIPAVSTVSAQAPVRSPVDQDPFASVGKACPEGASLLRQAASMMATGQYESALWAVARAESAASAKGVTLGELPVRMRVEIEFLARLDHALPKTGLERRQVESSKTENALGQRDLASQGVQFRKD